MPAKPTYPGVYIEEIPSGVRTITGVATSVGAFIGYFRRGPLNTAVQIFNMGDFEREFGGLDLLSEAGYAIQQFFLNGGTQAHVIRVADGSPRSSNVSISNVSPAEGEVLALRAINEGAWGDNIRVKIDYNTTVANAFNMLVTEYDDNDNILRQETWLNLSMGNVQTTVTTVINDENTGSEIIRVVNTKTLNPPVANGTLSGPHADINAIPTTSDTATLNVLVNGQAASATANFDCPNPTYSIREMALLLENALRAVDPANRELSGAKVSVSGNSLHITAGGDHPGIIITIEDSGDGIADKLELTDNASANIQEYSFGVNENGSLPLQSSVWATTTAYVVGDIVTEAEGAFICILDHTSDAANFATDVANWDLIAATWATATAYVEGDYVTESNTVHRCLSDHTSDVIFANDVTNWEAVNSMPISLDSAQISGMAGNNGLPPDGIALIGNLNNKTGIYALEDVDLFNILCIPRTAMITGNNALSQAEANTVITRAIDYCTEQRAFFIMDTPLGIDNFHEIKDWMSVNDTLRSRNAALYFPRVRIPDSLNDFRLRSVGASGTVAGLYARTDTNRGVWKAPAGTEATLKGVSQIEYVLSDQENGVLNPLGINCLRNFPVYGGICWGARTMEGADALASEWKYVPVRRLALFLEESLFRSTHWVVFEPNDEPLWAQIRLNVGAFMNNLFKQGAFQGTSPKDAYLVKCDSETTTQNDINLGIVNIVVGFAPLKPAEFVFIKIQQLTGQIDT